MMFNKTSNRFIAIFIIIIAIFACFYAKTHLTKWVYNAADFLYNDPEAIDFIASIGAPYEQLVRPVNTRPEHILTLYQMMKDVHDAMTIVELEYWVDFGTLLGVVRQNGIIPWDDDLDVTIHEKNHDKLTRCIIPALENLSYTAEYKEGTVKIRAHSGLITLSKNEQYPGCDIFIAREINNELVLTGWEEHSLKISEWKPLKKYHLGSLTVWGIANPNSYLSAWYGKNWQAIAVRGSDHITKDNSDSSGMPFLIKESEYVPAQPTGPLIDHTHEIQNFLRNINKNCLSSTEKSRID